MDEALYRLHAEREETYWWWVAKNRIILSLIQRFASPERSEGSGLPSRRALDIGCGAGGILARLSQPPFNLDAVGIDMSPIARDYCARRGLRALDGSLPGNLPFKEPASFDVIVMSEVIEHVKEDRESVAAAAALLRPGGLLVCTVPAHMWLWSKHDDFNFHQRRYTRKQFGDLFTPFLREPRAQARDASPTPDIQPPTSGIVLQQLVLSYYQAFSLPLIVGARQVEKVRTRLTGRAPKEPEVRPLPGPVNWMLTKAFEVERHWLPHARVPWGTSVISVHRRAG